MKFINTLQKSVLKAVAALANNGNIFKKRIKTAFNPKIIPDFNFFTNSQKMSLNYCPCEAPRTQRFPAHNAMRAFVLISMVVFSLTSCKKDAEIAPKAPTSTLAPLTSKASISMAPVKTSKDTIPDGAFFKIQLGKDSINTDETLIEFNHRAGLSLSMNYDAPYFNGFGRVNLASVSGNDVDLAIYNLPYTSGMSISLDAHARTDGAYFLRMSYEKNIPSDVHIFLKDTYLKDSVDVRSVSYNFKITKADTNSFGHNRFKLVIKSN
jgi:hypothetical protein